MDEEKFVVSEKAGSKPFGGLPEKESKWTKIYNTPAKKAGLAVIFVLLVISVCYARIQIKELMASSKKESEAHQTTKEPDTAVIIVKTTYPGIPIHVDPNQAIVAAPVMGNIAWEQAVNGIPIRRFPLKGKPIDLVDPDTIGTVRTMACRILENNGIDSAEFVYAKYPMHTQPPSGWFEAGLNTRH